MILPSMILHFLQARGQPIVWILLNNPLFSPEKHALLKMRPTAMTSCQAGLIMFDSRPFLTRMLTTTHFYTEGGFSAESTLGTDPFLGNSGNRYSKPIPPGGVGNIK
jgi:hypothetical protein